MFRGRLQLGTSDALYSDGSRYMPAIVVRDGYKSHLPAFRRVLLLGAGMASTAHILTTAGCTASYTLVDINEEILQWAMEYAVPEVQANVTPICDDAKRFMSTCTEQYDLIFIDIFIGRHVPDFVTGADFLKACSRCLTTDGRLALNFIVNDKFSWELMQEQFAKVFPAYRVVTKGENRILLT